MKNYFKNIIKRISSNFPLSLFVLFIGIATGKIIFTSQHKILSIKEQLSLDFSLVGWVIAFSLILFQINKTGKENHKLKYLEIKKGLQIEAFQQINSSITICCKTFTSLGTNYLFIAPKIRANLQNPNFDINSYLQPFHSGQYLSEPHKGYAYDNTINYQLIAVNYVDGTASNELTNHREKYNVFCN